MRTTPGKCVFTLISCRNETRCIDEVLQREARASRVSHKHFEEPDGFSLGALLVTKLYRSLQGRERLSGRRQSNDLRSIVAT